MASTSLRPSPDGDAYPGESNLLDSYRALQAILQALESSRDPDSFFRTLTYDWKLLSGVAAFGLVQYVDDSGDVQWCAMEPPGAAAAWLGRACLATFRSQTSSACGLADEFIWQQLRPLGLAAACTVPLTTANGRLGAALFASHRPDAFSATAIDHLEKVAAPLAIALEQVLQRAQSGAAQAGLQAHSAKLQTLLELNNAIVAELELPRLAQVISTSIRRLTPIDAVALMLPDAGDETLRMRALHYPEGGGSTITALDGLHRNSIAWRVFSSGEPWTGNPHAIDADFGYPGLQSLCVLPLIRNARVLGVLGLGRIEQTQFQPDDMDFLTQVANQTAIALENALVFQQAALPEMALLAAPVRTDLDGEAFSEIVGNSAALGQVLHHIRTVAPTQSTVLLCGETGTGKELIARAIHHLSGHRGEPFVKVNCAALPASLLESELFGHERGAFTGAVSQRLGRFELANEGTLFLDEISEISLELQPKLLRVLQEREFERLGSSRTLRTTARVVAATNRDLIAMVREGKFRADLFYRLHVFPLPVPPLRERAEDIPLLVSHFVRHYAAMLNKDVRTIAPASMSALTRYWWPGNIRELQNIIERAVLLSSGSVLELFPGDLDFIGQRKDYSSSPGSTLESVERQHILSVLEECNWVLAGPNGAAQRLGMKRTTLQFRMQKLGIMRTKDH